MPLARLLIIDDEAYIVTVMKKGLELAGFSVAIESDPIEAFKNFRRDAYDLVLLDGIELYGRLREIDSNFKVCFISTFVAGEYEKIRQQYPELVNNCFIEKPVTITRLVQIVKSRLNISQH